MTPRSHAYNNFVSDPMLADLIKLGLVTDRQTERPQHSLRHSVIAALADRLAELRLIVNKDQSILQYVIVTEATRTRGRLVCPSSSQQ